jgi:hypothetical protein
MALGAEPASGSLRGPRPPTTSLSLPCPDFITLPGLGRRRNPEIRVVSDGTGFARKRGPVRTLTIGPLLFLATALPSCSTHDCTAIGCIDQATLTFKTADGTWADGGYTMSIDASGTVHRCTFQLPADFPATGSLATVSCEPTLDVFIEQEVMCTETRTGDGVSQSCTPVAGHFHISANLPDTPESVTVTLSRDGVELLNTSQMLAYETVQPNGPECGPGCRESSLELTVTE